MRRACAALVCSLAAVAGCGGGGEPASSPAPSPPSVFRVAIAGPANPDPVAADDRPALFVARQVYEPLTAVAEPPYGRPGVREGLVRGIRPNRDATVWTARLRHGVRFSDGALFNARAVEANARRWAAEEPNPLPRLITADAPQTDLVRLFFADPVRDLPERLDDPRLGVVSPRALEPRRGERYRFHPAGAAGTGPFRIERRSPEAIVLARNPEWWGAAAGLGPALARVELIVEPDPAVRFALLDSGEVELADELGQAEGPERRELRADPLLELIKVPRAVLGVERSVRGISPARGTPLAGVWLTGVGRVGSVP